MNYTHDYTSCMMMKLKLADPDRKGGSKIYFNCERALEIIKDTDKLTLGIKKIVYLVGWQYLGHDDKYPAFFEANNGIGFGEYNPHQSLLWLINEAKKYNTVVSVHINFTDAYEDSPLYGEYLNNKALIRNRYGNPAKIERYNGKDCYKISYKEEWESGLFKNRIDRLLEYLPIEEAGTVHVDNMQCYVNRKPYVSAQEMQYYRNKMIEYLRKKGIDITSEFTYREGKWSIIGYGKVTRDITPTRYPISLIGEIPAVWWTDKMTIDEYFKYYPHIYGGGLPKSKKIMNLFYGNIHGEDIWANWVKNGNTNWHSDFLKQFVTVNIPFYYLNGKERVGFIDKKQNSIFYTDGTISYADGTIQKGDEIIKKGNNVFLPYLNGFVAFNEKDGVIDGYTGDGRYDISEITVNGLEHLSFIDAQNNRIKFNATGGKAYFILKTIKEEL